MRYIHAADIEHAVAELCITACCCVPADVMAALEKALFVEAEGGSRARRFESNYRKSQVSCRAHAAVLSGYGPGCSIS